MFCACTSPHSKVNHQFVVTQLWNNFTEVLLTIRHFCTMNTFIISFLCFLDCGQYLNAASNTLSPWCFRQFENSCRWIYSTPESPAVGTKERNIFLLLQMHLMSRLLSLFQSDYFACFYILRKTSPLSYSVPTKLKLPPTTLSQESNWNHWSPYSI